MQTTDLTKNQIVLVSVSGEQTLAVMVSPMPLLQGHGADPAVWAEVLASLVESMAKAHQECLSKASGERPDLDEIRTRILEVLPVALEHKRQQPPLVDHILRGDEVEH